MPIVTPRLRLPLPRLRKGRSGFAPRAATRARLSELDGVRDNPGNLRARCYVPDGLAPGAPLVVVLHGCTQDAAVYDHGAGWSTLADRHGFALLFPEQQRANNPMLCFNWFAPEDTGRGRGEAASIAAMVEAMKKAHGVDPQRIFVTGLSAGGAMAAAMLATYPDLFAAGAILAGVAYGCASRSGRAAPTPSSCRPTPTRSSCNGRRCRGWRRGRTGSTAWRGIRAARGWDPTARRWSSR